MLHCRNAVSKDATDTNMKTGSAVLHSLKWRTNTTYERKKQNGSCFMTGSQESRKQEKSSDTAEQSSQICEKWFLLYPVVALGFVCFFY